MSRDATERATRSGTSLWFNAASLLPKKAVRMNMRFPKHWPRAACFCFAAADGCFAADGLQLLKLWPSGLPAEQVAKLAKKNTIEAIAVVTEPTLTIY